MPAPEVAAKLVKEESARLESYLTSLPPDAWTRPSACGDWEVGDVVAHLAGAARLYGDMVSRGLRGDSSTPEGRPPPGSPDFRGSYGEVIARRSIDLRKGLGDRVLDEYKTTNEVFNRLLASLSPTDWEKPCYLPTGVYPAKRFAGFRMLELALHGWDIRSKLKPSGGLHAESVPMLVELLPTVLKWFFALPDGFTAHRRYRFALANHNPTAIDLLIDGRTASLGPPIPLDADATLFCSAETFVLLMSGRVEIEPAVREGLISVAGDSQIWHVDSPRASDGAGVS